MPAPVRKATPSATDSKKVQQDTKKDAAQTDSALSKVMTVAESMICLPTTNKRVNTIVPFAVPCNRQHEDIARKQYKGTCEPDELKCNQTNKWPYSKQHYKV